MAGRDLVCGDIVLLAEGDRVPADMALVEASNLTVDESMLSRESVPVSKQIAPAAGATDAPGPAEVEGQVFSGTLVTQGTAQGQWTQQRTPSRHQLRSMRSAVDAWKQRRFAFAKRLLMRVLSISARGACAWPKASRYTWHGLAMVSS